MRSFLADRLTQAESCYEKMPPGVGESLPQAGDTGYKAGHKDRPPSPEVVVQWVRQPIKTLSCLSGGFTGVASLPTPKNGAAQIRSRVDES